VRKIGLNSAGRALEKGMMSRIKSALCVFFAIFFIAAGVMHFVAVDKFAAIVPPLLPFPKLIVWVTGVMEIGMGVMLLCPHFRPRVGVLLGLFLLAVLPANIYMAVAEIPFGDSVASPAALWMRVALQFPLIAVIFWATRPAKTV
jgi:uncharacterized membrane protein